MVQFGPMLEGYPSSRVLMGLVKAGVGLYVASPLSAPSCILLHPSIGDPLEGFSLLPVNPVSGSPSPRTRPTTSSVPGWFGDTE